MPKILPNMLAYCLMLSSPYYAKNYAGIMDSGLGLVLNPAPLYTESKTGAALYLVATIIFSVIISDLQNNY